MWVWLVATLYVTVALPARYVFRQAARVLVAAGMCWDVHYVRRGAVILFVWLSGWLVVPVLLCGGVAVSHLSCALAAANVSHAMHCLMLCCKVVFAPGYCMCVSLPDVHFRWIGLC